jgi:hypothetical protein
MIQIGQKIDGFEFEVLQNQEMKKSKFVQLPRLSGITAR